MLVRVLGPLLVDGSQGPVPVGGRIPRRLLCALAARPGAVVPLDALVQAAWGDEAPATAERTLASHVTRLREALAAAGDPAAARIERANEGYRLAVGDDAVDALRFEHAVMSISGDPPPPERVAALRDALGLWRTPVAFADLVDTAYPAAEAARLVELRGTATEALIEAAIDAGDPADAVREAEAALVEWPYRERLWELLVLALYRQGRQSDALDAYRRARAALREGLGVDPGAGLRRMEERVLAQDPALLAPVGVPARHPCPYKGLARYDEGDADLFVGRERLVEELLARLVDGSLLVVAGASGAGKSSLVRAGLVPALARGGLPGSAAWGVAVVTPGRDACRRCAARCPGVLPSSSWTSSRRRCSSPVRSSRRSRTRCSRPATAGSGSSSCCAPTSSGSCRGTAGSAAGPAPPPSSSAHPTRRTSGGSSSSRRGARGCASTRRSSS